jgi:hypothetical protein
MKKYPILLIAWLLPVSARAETMREKLEAAFQGALQNYCIPKDAEYCTGEEGAVYKDGRCECRCLGMIYDKTSRKCVDGHTSCSSGYYLTSNTASACPAGFMLVSDGDTSCDAGYYLASNTATSCPAGYRLEGGSSRWCDLDSSPMCAAGYRLVI